MRNAVRNFVRNEEGAVLLLVLMLLMMGSLVIAPSLKLADTALRAKQVQSDVLAEQYVRDAGAEFAVWNLMYGDATTTITEGNPDQEYTVNLNGETTTVTLAWHAAQDSLMIPSAEDDKIRPSSSVICDKDGDGFDDDCLKLPKDVVGMVARYTVFFEQISPNTEEGITVAFDELPLRFTYVPGSTVSQDDSITMFEPTVRSTNENTVLEWDFATAFGSPLLLEHGETKQFSFDAMIDKSEDRYCNSIYLSPNKELSGTVVPVHVGDPSDDQSCRAGNVTIAKFVDSSVALPSQSTTFTYVINIENVNPNSVDMNTVRDFLPQGGFRYVNNSASYKVTGSPFDPLTDSFLNIPGDIPLLDTYLQKTILPNGRQQLVWSNPGGAWSLDEPDDDTSDTLIIRFQAIATLEDSGTYFNEVFGDVVNDCVAPQHLVDLGIFTSGQEDAEYCSRYSWPTAGIIVPSYDVGSESGGLTGNGNVILVEGDGTARLDSWHLN